MGNTVLKFVSMGFMAFGFAASSVSAADMQATACSVLELTTTSNSFIAVTLAECKESASAEGKSFKLPMTAGLNTMKTSVEYALIHGLKVSVTARRSGGNQYTLEQVTVHRAPL